MGSVSRFYTNTYSDGNALTIVEDNGMSQVTLSVISGTCTIQGNYKLGQQLSGPITLPEGANITLSSRGPGTPLDGIIITPSNPGSVGIVLQP